MTIMKSGIFIIDYLLDALEANALRQYHTATNYTDDRLHPPISSTVTEPDGFTVTGVSQRTTGIGTMIIVLIKNL